MEAQFLISPDKPSPSIHALPFLLSCNSSSFLQKTRSGSDTRFSFSAPKLKKTPFLGRALSLKENRKPRSNPTTRLFAISAGAVKRRKELPFDSVIQRDKKLKLALKIRKILMTHPDRIMPLRDLGRFRKALGLEKRRRSIALLKRFPAVFEIVEEGVYSLRFKLTPEAERLYLEEMRIRNEMEDLLVIKLRKLLMMSMDKRILLEKIAHLMADLGLPLEFRDTICHRYPQYFRVVATGLGPALELTHWDPDVAVSAAELAEEDNRQREMDEKDLIIDRAPRFNRVKMPKGLNLSKGEMRRIAQFRDIPYISPYSDFSGLRAGTAEKEKHACAVIHEILSLTVEKRTLVDHLTHFREEFRFSQQLRGMLIRHPDMFYVSLKGDRDSVFLREAYRDSQLIEKDKLLLVKEKFRVLVNIARFQRRKGPRDASDEAGENKGEDDEWSDNDDLGSGADSDDGEDEDEAEDEWSEGDDVPPDFSDEEDEALSGSEIISQSSERGKGSGEDEDKDHVPVFPDGRVRERW